MKRYEKYKDSGVKWLGEVPDKWKVVRFKNIFKEINDRSLNGVEDLLSVSQFTGVTKKSDKLDEGDLLTSANSLEGYKLVRKGDLVSNIMLAWNGSLAFSGYDGITSPAYSVYRVKTKDDNRFLHYLVRSEIYKAEFKRNSSGVIESRLRLYTDDFFAIYGLVPPLSEQKAIAEFLDDKTSKIDHGISIKEKEINLLKERRQILIQELVTGKKIWDGNKWTKPTKTKDSGVDWIGEIPEHWEVRKLKQICRINANSLDENVNPNFEFQYVDIGSVTFEEGILKTENFLFKNSPSRARRSAKKGDTIVSTVRTYLKAIDFVDEEKSDFIYSTGFAVLEPNQNIYPKFLYSFVKSNAFTEQVSVNSKGMSYPAINSTELGNQWVVFFPFDEQTEIVNHLEQIEEKISKAISLKQQEIEKLKEYKTVLIDNVVTGKIKIV